MIEGKKRWAYDLRGEHSLKMQKIIILENIFLRKQKSLDRFCLMLVIKFKKIRTFEKNET